VTLHPLTRDAFEAALELCARLPSLPESQRLFAKNIRPLGRAVPGRLPERWVDLLRRAGPTGLLQERLLSAFDQQLRTFSGPHPQKRILALAEAAGVSPAIRRRYQRQAGAVLSQWVHLDAKKPPRTLYLRLRNEHSRFDHGVFWGRNSSRVEGELGTPSRRYAGPLPPGGSWQELRVPLVWLGVQDRPIEGFLFGQVGGGSVVWDRTAIVIDGKEHVVLDDEMPKCSADDSWQWTGRPTKSGRRAHTQRPPRNWREDSYHRLWDLDPPIVAHRLPPAAGALVSQWIYLDPADPPEHIGLAVRDVNGRTSKFAWGRERRDYAFLGPLPKPGTWAELRVPLAGTIVSTAPIDGFSFLQHEGRAIWDRTALRSDAGERVIIDDAWPPDARDSDAAWVEQPAKSGAKAHTHKRQGSGSHYVHFPEAPIHDHLPFETDAAAAILKENIPKLGPSDAAWRLFEALLNLDLRAPERDIRLHQWFVRALPGHPQVTHVLGHLVAQHKALEREKPAERVLALAKEAGVPRQTLYEFRREFRVGRNAFIRSWLIIGPFPSPGGRGFAKAFPPETEGVRLGRAYTGAAGAVRWQRHEAKDEAIDLAALFEPNEHVAAYAACWIRSERARPAVIELGTDDGFKLWLNGEQVGAEPTDRALERAQNVIPVLLRRGWNELLLKVINIESKWEFVVELADRKGRGLLERVTVSGTPPER
jgi:hypothetical protein